MKTSRNIVPLAGALAALVASAAAPPPASAVEYLQVCSGAGAGYFYIPGTSTCVNAYQISANQFDLARDFSRALTGIAMTSALVTPFIPDKSRFAVSLHVATYEGANAVGLAGAIRLVGNWSLTGGLAFGTDRGAVTLSTAQASAAGTLVPVQTWSSIDVLGKMGVNYAW
jgi:hypothetical protein